MQNRNDNRTKLKDRAHELMSNNPTLCGDKTHLLAQILFREKYGILLTEDQIRHLNSIDRARRNVFKLHPNLDIRARTKGKLAANDKKYFSGGSND